MASKKKPSKPSEPAHEYQFWCPYCHTWLHEDSTVHSEGHHHDIDKVDDNVSSRSRISYDGGKTWVEE